MPGAVLVDFAPLGGAWCCFRPRLRLKDFLWVCKGKIELLVRLKLKNPGAVFDLIAVMELGVVRGAIEPRFVDDFEPAVTEPA